MNMSGGLTEEQIENIASQVAGVVVEKLQKHKITDAMTVKDVAAYIGIKPSTVRAYVRKKDFPLPRKIGRLFSFDRKEVEEWWDRKAKESSAIYRPEGK